MSARFQVLSTAQSRLWERFRVECHLISRLPPVARGPPASWPPHEHLSSEHQASVCGPCPARPQSYRPACCPSPALHVGGGALALVSQGFAAPARTSCVCSLLVKQKRTTPPLAASHSCEWKTMPPPMPQIAAGAVESHRCRSRGAPPAVNRGASATR